MAQRFAAGSPLACCQLTVERERRNGNEEDVHEVEGRPALLLQVADEDIATIGVELFAREHEHPNNKGSGCKSHSDVRRGKQTEETAGTTYGCLTTDGWTMTSAMMTVVM